MDLSYWTYASSVRTPEDERLYTLAHVLREVFLSMKGNEDEPALVGLARHIVAHCDEFSIQNMLTQQPKP